MNKPADIDIPAIYCFQLIHRKKKNKIIGGENSMSTLQHHDAFILKSSHHPVNQGGSRKNCACQSKQ